jgi:phospholipase/lecithinase/hemolysin
MQFVKRGNDSSMSRYADWNAALCSSITSFASEHPDATALLFSSNATFTRVLVDPEGHGFHDKDAARKPGKGIWMDFLHPTNKMHDIVAKDLAAFLGTVTKNNA